MRTGGMAISLLLAMLCGLLWIRSYTVIDGVAYGRRAGLFYQVISQRGWLSLDLAPNSRLDQRMVWMHRRADLALAGHRLGSGDPVTGISWFGASRFGGQVVSLPGPSRFAYSAAVPHGLLVALLCAWPAIHGARAVRRRMRGSTGCTCVACGYDLRATPTRCPECGRVLTVQEFLDDEHVQKM